MMNFKELITELKIKYGAHIEIISESEVKLYGDSMNDEMLRDFLGDIEIIMTTDLEEFNRFCDESDLSDKYDIHLVDFKYSDEDCIDVVYQHNVIWANENSYENARLIEKYYTPLKVKFAGF